MQSLYNSAVREYVHTRDWPKGLLMDVVEDYVEHEGMTSPYLQFVFYRDNFNQFPAEQQMIIATSVNEVMLKLRKDGIPCYLEVKAHA